MPLQEWQRKVTPPKQKTTTKKQRVFTSNRLTQQAQTVGASATSSCAIEK